MTARTTMNQDDSADKVDVLTGDEESALCLFREIVCRMRAHRMAADVAAVEQAMVDAGVARVDEKTACEPWALKHGSARFSLLSRPKPAPGIEIYFSPGKQ
jgi:hypothetical protein